MLKAIIQAKIIIIIVIMLDGNLNLHKGIKSTGNAMWVNTKEFYLFFKFSFKDDYLL